MRTTVNIDEHLLRTVKELAARSDRSVGAIVDDALRVFLGTHDLADSPAPISLPAYGGSGVRPGVDLEDKEALADLLDSSSAAGRRAAG